MPARLIAEQEAGVHSGLYKEIRRSLGAGTVPNIFKAMAALHADVLVHNWIAYRRTFLQGELSRQCKEMIGLVAARASGCRYGLQLHATHLLALGARPAAVSGLVETGACEGLSAAEAAALAFARTAWADPATAVTTPLEKAGLSEEQITEVVDTLLLVAGLSRFARESELPPDSQG